MRNKCPELVSDQSVGTGNRKADEEAADSNPLNEQRLTQ